LARLGYHVDILTRQFEDFPAEEAVADHVRLLRFPCGGPAFIPKETLCYSIPEWVENVCRFVRADRLEYLLINSHYWDAGLAGQALARRLAVPHYHTPHSIATWKRDNMDGDPQELERRYNFRHRIREERVIYQECDLLIATTPAQRDILRGEEYDVLPEKIRVIPPGYDDRRFFQVGSATRQSLKADLNLEGRVVLAIGRIARNKGYDLLIDAMVPVVERFDDARLVLAIGSTEPTAEEVDQIDTLRQRVRERNLSGHVDFRDYVPDALLADYYRAADVFALSSRYEPFGMTAVEAMACGTPTVITTEGGLWEQVVWGLEALYANPFDPSSFGHHIAAIFQHPAVARQLSNNGAQKARARFTWTGIAQQLLRNLEMPSESLPRVELSDTPVAPPASLAEHLPLAPRSEPADTPATEEQEWQAEACL
jgi:mannosylfructose-phosphate synthase